ncbi:MAG: hypothetical protein LBQ45_00065 [Mycoplasmataceae bacterium]|nr:hypothetical protein [Mycoplasmataceae bacterium]
MIGIVEGIKKEEKKISFDIKVEKPTSDQECWYEKIPATIEETDESVEEINKLTEGAIVGVKGRVTSIDNAYFVQAERLQVF